MEPTRLQAGAHRFRRRRIEQALLGADPGAVRPARARSLAAGAVVAALWAAGAGLLALTRPAPELADAPILMDTQSGALYVRVGDDLHPVPNLASARLITQSDAPPRPVRAADIGRARRGPQLGIAGAPASLESPLSAQESVWTVCDSAGHTTVRIGPIPPTQPETARTLLVTPESGQTTYLLYGGHKAVVSLHDPAVVRALHLEQMVPQVVSRLLLDSVGEVPPIVAPPIPGVGRPGALPGIPVGTVLRVPRAGSEEYDVVLRDGLQRIGQVTADLLRLTDTQGGREVLSVSPDSLRTVRVVHSLPVDDFPERSEPIGPSATVCLTWTAGRSTITAGAEMPLPADVSPVALAQADGSGPLLDAVSLPPGRSVYASATDASYLITAAGVRYAVRGDDAARSLGLPNRAVVAPWPMLAALPRGPELSRAAALTARDTSPTSNAKPG